MSGLGLVLDIAKTALSTQQYGIDVTGHNIANVNNPSYSRQSPTPEPNLNLSGTSLPPTLLAQNSPDALFLQSLSARQSNSPSESDRNSRMHEALVNASPGTSTWQRNLQNANPTWQPSPNRREFEYNSTVDTYYALRTGNSSSQFSEDSNR